MAEVSREELAGIINRLDISCLLALATLARDGIDGRWIQLDVLAQRIHALYGRYAQNPDSIVGSSSPPWELAPGASAEAEDYVREQVVGRLVSEGLLETLTDGDRVAVRFAPLPIDPTEIEAEVETRIDDLDRVGGPSTSASSATIARKKVVSDRSNTLSAAGLVKVYRKRRVVNDVALRVSQGEIVGLLGPNGAGKTTTFYMMVGLIAPDEGRVTIGGDDVTEVPMYKRARRGIGYLSQEPSIFRKLTVEQNILAILQMLQLTKEEQRRRLEELLDELGIKHLRASKAYSLSGGERRRLEITRALVGQPKFMLLDEPFAGVDPIAVHDIQQIVSDLRRRNIGVLISDHNVEQTLDIVDRAYIMYDGRVRVSGTVSELVWNDEVAEIYLGPTLTARMRQRYTYPD